MRILSSPNSARRIAVAATLPVAVLALAGCASSQGSNTPMNGGGMMNGAHDYSTSPSTCSSTPSSLPGATVVVSLTDMGMTRMMSGVAPMSARMRLLTASAATVAHGQVSFVADNRGWRTHELVILPLTGSAPAGARTAASDGKVSETGSLGEASANCGAGAGGGINAGSASWVTLTLPAGRYELVCNLTNHYTDGMHQELTVT